MENAKLQILDELASQNTNILRVRTLCRENHGLIALTGLRNRIWSLFLLGNAHLQDISVESDDDSVLCKEQQVLEADVPRTRGDLPEFRSPEYRKALFRILHRFCIKHDIQYKQGMNEVLAPFVFTNPPSQDNGQTFALFEAFLFRYLERYFCCDDSSFLFKAFRLFHILLVYHDPQLALHLHALHFPPELYAPQWFLTLYSRSLPVEQVLRLWDALIVVDDPAFTFFIGLCLLRRLREDLLRCEPELLPEIISRLGLRGDEDIDDVLTNALKAYRETPRCFCRHLRLVCVTSTELSPSPSVSRPQPSSSPSPTTHQNRSTSSIVGKYDHNVAMAVQSVRSSIMISAQELVDALAPLAASPSSRKSLEERNLPTLPSQFVLIDVRSADECEKTGSGVLPRAIQLEPEFLERPDAFEVWLEHFDNAKGCPIVIIDMPPVNLPGVALWRRLLLGEGDGLFDNTYGYSKSQMVGGRDAANTAYERDHDSPFAEEESKALAQDAVRPAVKLAHALQRASFPSVSVLEGGFPCLVSQLMDSRGTTEPVITNHNIEKWEKYLELTGRRELVGAKMPKYNKLVAIQSSASNSPEKNSGQPSPLEATKVALQVATRLGHTTMQSILEERLKNLSSAANR